MTDFTDQVREAFTGPSASIRTPFQRGGLDLP